MVLTLKNILYDKLSPQKLDVILTSSNTAERSDCNIYLVGGVVRDLIMDNSVCDIDIAVEGDAIKLAEEIKTQINCKIINTQDNLKTAKIKFKNNEEIDFASTREELYPDSGILPKAYNFGCKLKEDVKRRDFTINTLAIKLTGKDKFSLIDYFDGYNDIETRKIRVLHDKSFIDDPSRIIRALKFAKRFNFEIEASTYDLMQKYLNNIKSNMPLERIKHELKHYFSLKNQDLYENIIKTNAYKLVSGDIPEHIYIERFEALEKYNIIKPDDYWFIYLCALIVNTELENLKLNLNSSEKRVIKETKKLLESNISETDNKKIYKAFIKCNPLSAACFYVMTENTAAVDKFLNELKNIKTETTGKDLIELGFEPSPYFNEIFEQLLDKKLNGELKNKQQEIVFLKQLKQLKQK